MALKDETDGIVFSVSAKADKSLRSVVGDLQEIDKASKSTSRNLRRVAQSSQTNIAAINELSGVAKHFAKSFSKSALAAASEFEELHNKIEKTSEQIDKIQAKIEDASEEAKPALKGKLASLEKTIGSLNGEVGKLRATHKKQLAEMIGTTGKIHKVGRKLEGFASQKGNFGTAFKQLFSGDIKGGASGIASSAAKAAQSGAGRAGGAALNAGNAASAESMAMVAGGIAAAAAAFAVFIKLITAASNHMTTLNKALISGTTLGDDFGMTADQYRKSLSNIRSAVVATSGSFLALGATSEDRLKAIGAFAKEASGSLLHTEGVLAKMGRGNIQAGAEEFSKNAILYGKALGTNAEDVAGMMGKWVTDIGYSADNVQGIMSGVVKMAVTSNMPIHKFMDIFRQVLPSVDMYINRMEELTGVIKVLSKTMSAESVKKFMNAFSQGFDKMDFKSRLGLYFKAGPENVKATTAADQANQAASISSQFSVMGKEFQGRLEKAIKSGNTDLVASMASDAGAAGVQGSAIEAALQTSRYAKASKQGGALQDTFAMRGMGAYGRYKTLQGATQFAKVDMFSGMGENIAKQSGISEDMYDGLMKMDSSMRVWASEVQRTGITSSNAINKQMRAAVEGKTGKKFGSDKEVEDWMKKQDQKTIQDVILRASSMDQALTEKQKKSMEELAEEQTTQTKSVGEKIENIIGYMLEKIYSVLNDSILGVLDGLWRYTTSNEDQRTQIKLIDAMNRQFQKDYKGAGPGVQKQFKMVSEEISRGIGMGLKGQGLADYVGKSGTLELGKMDKKGLEAEMMDYMKSAGYDESVARAKWNQADIGSAGTTQDVLERLTHLGPEKDAGAIMMRASKQFGVGALASGMESGRRPGTGEVIKSGKDVTDTAAEFIRRRNAQGANIPGVGAEADAAEAVTTTADQTQIAADAATTTATQGEKSNKIAEKEQKAVDHMDKTGMKMDKGFLNNDYFKIIKNATYESFSRALVEFSVILAKMWDDEGFRSGLASSAAGVMNANVPIGELLDPNLAAFIADPANQRVPGAQTGADVRETGVAMLHAGEHVLSPTETASHNQNAGRNSNVTNNFYINGANDPKKTAQEVYRILGDMARRH